MEAVMKKWNVMALCLGTLDLYKGVVTLGLDFNRFIREPIWAYAVYNDTHKILVDNGVHSAKWTNENMCKCNQHEDETLESVLEKGLGWTLDDVDAVINTHLHYDHCGRNRDIKNAEFYVQKTEFEYAFSPFKTQKQYYYDFLVGPEVINHFRWRLLDGDADLFPGIKVITTPGHSPGHQSVLVDTAEGVCCIAGDAAGILQNFSRKTPNACSIKLNEEDIFHSVDKMAMCANFALPGHDPNIKKFQHPDFPS
jgi:glyoxylase-like metal-dependent hydrolase (beta-lactamase superfamily II)